MTKQEAEKYYSDMDIKEVMVPKKEAGGIAVCFPDGHDSATLILYNYISEVKKHEKES